jgi:hypothetical protein
MRRLVGVVTVLFWASVVLVTVLVGALLGRPRATIRTVLPQLKRRVGGAGYGFSAFLFWQELRNVRRKSYVISVEEGDEWTPKAWLYATAFGLSFFVRGTCCQPVLFLSRNYEASGETLTHERALCFSVDFYPTPQHVVLTRMRQAGGVLFPRSDGQGLYRMLHPNFREFLFQKLSDNSQARARRLAIMRVIAA